MEPTDRFMVEAPGSFVAKRRQTGDRERATRAAASAMGDAIHEERLIILPPAAATLRQADWGSLNKIH